MSIKLKPSSKQYIKDSKGKMTNKFNVVHYTPSSTSTKELLEWYGASSYKKKRASILKELKKRNITPPAIVNTTNK